MFLIFTELKLWKRKWLKVNYFLHNRKWLIFNLFYKEPTAAFCYFVLCRGGHCYFVLCRGGHCYFVLCRGGHCYFVLCRCGHCYFVLCRGGHFFFVLCRGGHCYFVLCTGGHCFFVINTEVNIATLRYAVVVDSFCNAEVGIATLCFAEVGLVKGTSLRWYKWSTICYFLLNGSMFFIFILDIKVTLFMLKLTSRLLSRDTATLFHNFIHNSCSSFVKTGL